MKSETKWKRTKKLKTAKFSKVRRKKEETRRNTNYWEQKNRREGREGEIGKEACRGEKWVQKAVEENAAFSHAQRRCLPAAPFQKNCPQLTSKLPQNAGQARGQREGRGKSRLQGNNLAQRQRVSRTNATRESESWLWQIARKMAKRGRGGQSWTRGSKAGKVVEEREVKEGGFKEEACCHRCLQDKWAKARETQAWRETPPASLLSKANTCNTCCNLQLLPPLSPLLSLISLPLMSLLSPFSLCDLCLASNLCKLWASCSTCPLPCSCPFFYASAHSPARVSSVAQRVH